MAASRRSHAKRSDIGSPSGGAAPEPVGDVLAAIGGCAPHAGGTDLTTVVRATGLSWTVASAMADRLRRGGLVVRLPHGRLVLSTLGRAAAGLA